MSNAKIKIADGVFVSKGSLVFKFSRSSGPGGQNVNKVNTRVTVFFDVAGCDKFSDSQKKWIFKRLATRIDKDGVIRVVSQKYRTQKDNRAAALERLSQLLTEAVRERVPRKKTKVPRAAVEKRLQQKRQRSMLKQQRVKINLAREIES